MECVLRVPLIWKPSYALSCFKTFLAKHVAYVHNSKEGLAVESYKLVLSHSFYGNLQPQMKGEDQSDQKDEFLVC